jgi:hypothetical protein
MKPEALVASPLRQRLALLLLGLMPACSPVLSGAHIVQAERHLAACEAAGARQAAPYEYQAARSYLEEARVHNAYARFGLAQELADKAAEYAVQAKEKATLSSGAAPACKEADK